MGFSQPVERLDAESDNRVLLVQPVLTETPFRAGVHREHLVRVEVALDADAHPSSVRGAGNRRSAEDT